MLPPIPLLNLSVAVLIDGDNASFEKMEDVMRFVSRYGTAVVRRIYGDWTKKSLSGWKDAARDYSFRMVQASSFVSGKNTTDIALVMDAMDILHEGRVGCFCLVASDGDYTLLAQRIRESGLMVLGYGEGKTPVALVRSCTGFLLADRKEEICQKAHYPLPNTDIRTHADNSPYRQTSLIYSFPFNLYKFLTTENTKDTEIINEL